MATNTICILSCAALLFAATQGLAQTDETQEPLSAIDWLSDVVRDAPPPLTRDPEGDVAKTAIVPTVTTMPLGQLKLDAVGILPRSATGLPKDFWTRSSAMTLARQIRGMRTDLPPPLGRFLNTVLLTELPAPADSTEGAELFLARVDKFLKTGALDQAEALLARAGPTRPEVFSRWFDVSLLRSSEDQACRSMLETPTIAPTYPARIFCLAREGDWDAAVVTLGTGKTLGLINEREEALLARFLDPELFEGEPVLSIPDRITPLNFRMHEAIGEPLSPGGLPNAFSFATLDERNGWKARINAAERLARLSAIPPQTLFAVYAERQPAASGGVWDRVAAVQQVETALAAGDPEAIAETLTPALRSLRSAGLEHAFAQNYGEAIARVALPPKPALEAYRTGLMSNGYETVATQNAPPDAPPLWGAIAMGTLADEASNDALEAAIIAGFNASTPPAQFADLMTAGRIGEAVLKALNLLADGPRTDPADVERGLALLTQLGLQDVARQTALHMLLTRPGS